MLSERINTVDFDIDFTGAFCDGKLSFADGKIIKTIGENKTEYSLDEAESLQMFVDVGCGRLEIKRANSKTDENIAVCRFTMSQVNGISEFVKVVNYYLETGEMTDIGAEKKSYCPKCSRQFMDGMSECIFCVKKSYVFSRALKMFKEYIPQIVKISIVLIFSTIMTVLTPKIQGILIDDYLAPAENSQAFFSSAQKGLVVMILALVGAYLLGILLKIVGSVMVARTGTELSSDLRKRLYNKVQEMSVSSVSKHTSGDLIKRVTHDVEHITDFFVSIGSRLVEKIAMFIVVLAILFVTNYKLTLLVLLPIPLIVFMFNRVQYKIRKINRQEWRASSRETSILHDIIKGIRVVKSFGNEEKEVQKFAKAAKHHSEVSIISGRFWALFFEPITFIVGIGEFLVLIFGGRMVLDGALTLGEFVQFNLYLAYLYQPLRWMSMLPRRATMTSTCLIKAYEILDEEIDVDDKEKTEQVPYIEKIKFDNVTFGYKSYEPVLKNIDFTIDKGEMIGLVGHSGAGKSTMINLLIRLFDPNNGSIKINGIDMRKFSQREWRDKIGVVFQETFLFSGTIYDNIVYAQNSASCRDVIEAAKMANAHEFIMKLPDGYNTVIGENGYKLSGGERQRIAIARAVLKNPEILILDEATSALDPETEKSIQEALERLIKNRTTVAIAHRLSTLRNADRLVVIENGSIAELGSHKELLDKQGIYYNLVMAQRLLSKRNK